MYSQLSEENKNKRENSREGFGGEQSDGQALVNWPADEMEGSPSAPPDSEIGTPGKNGTGGVNRGRSRAPPAFDA